MLELNDKDTLRDIAGTLFLQVYPQEEGFFEFAWDRLLVPPETPVNRTQELRLDGLGISGDSGGPEKEMAKLVVILVEAFLDKHPDGRQELLSRLQTCALRHGQTEARARLMVRVVEGELDDLASPDSSYAYVDMLSDGKHTQGVRRSPRHFNGILDHKHYRKYDLIVDEPNHKMRVEDRAPESLDSIARLHRAMLWLVMMKVGKIISFEDIRKATSRGSKDTIPQLKFLFGQCVGERLRSAILVSYGPQQYRVSSTGWSFCWIRKGEDSVLKG